MKGDIIMQEFTQQFLGYIYITYCRINGKIYIGQKKSKNNTGKLWICNKDNVTKFIKQNELNYYLNQGFCLGRKWVNNNE